MSIKRIHLLFSLIFIVFITAPSVVTLIDDDCNMSIFYGFGDDEKESEEKEGQKTFELNFVEVVNNQNESLLVEHRLDANYYLNTFKELHLEKVSPPPEQI